MTRTRGFWHPGTHHPAVDHGGGLPWPRPVEVERVLGFAARNGCKPFQGSPLRKTLVIHYDEIALKGRNRGAFEDHLVRGVREITRDLGPVSVQKLYGRILVRGKDSELPLPALAARVTLLPGVRYVLEGGETGQDFDAILQAIEDSLPPQEAVGTFGVRAKRGDKSYPLRSGEIERRAGAHVLERRSWDVDLVDPDFWVRIEIVNGRGLVCTERHEGPGGLPTGASGRGVALLSGGIDSPVAAWMMMTRGLRLTGLHFHSAPYTNQRSQEKVRDLARHLARFQPSFELTMIPFAEPIQQAIVTSAPQKYRVILYRRFMMRLAAHAAAAAKAGCIVTGEALGQVASQTVENMATVEAASSLPVLRPLVGMGKAKIIDVARRIGTFDTSIEPHDDCCSYLMPRSPATRSNSDELDEVERVFDVTALVEESWANRQSETLRQESRL